MRPRIRFVPVRHDNWEEVAALRLSPGQKHLFAPNWYSLLQAQFEGGDARAIYCGDSLVGFLYYQIQPEHNAAILFRLMIDADSQGFGYGRAALELWIAQMRADPAVRTLWLTVSPTNAAAVHLYESVGFAATGAMDFDEAVYQLQL